MGTRRVTTVTLVALFLCTSACLVTAQSVAMEPVGEVEDHPPAAIVKDFDSPSDALGSVPEENMQSLFNWAIENSDPDTLRQMAEESKGDGVVLVEEQGDGDEPPNAKEEKPKAKAQLVKPKKLTQAEMLAMRKDVKEALDLLQSNPSEQQFIKQAVDMFSDKKRSMSDRLLALEEMEDLVGPIDNANDLKALNALAPLIATAVDVSGDTPDAVAAAALGVLAIASSNNPTVGNHIHSWRGCSDSLKESQFGIVHGHENIQCASGSEKTAAESVAARLATIAVGDSHPAPSAQRQSKALRALSSLTRSHFPSRRAFFASNGYKWMQKLFNSNDENLKMRAFALADDFWQAPDVEGGTKKKGFPKGRQNEELVLAEMMVPELIKAMNQGSSDSREKAFSALQAALSRIDANPSYSKKKENMENKGKAGAALGRLVKYFEEEAASRPEMAEHALKVAGEAKELAGKINAIGTGHEEL